MGNFYGHIIPGSFFIFFAMWWTIQIFRRYYNSLRRNGPPYVSTPTWKVCLGRFGLTDIEAQLTILFTLIGIIIEVVISPWLRGVDIGGNNAQHGTMYFCFGMFGIASLVLPRLKVFLNYDSIVYCLLALAYTVEGLLFKFHLFGKDDLDVMVHTLLLYAIYPCVAITLAELRFRENFLCALARAYFTLLQGTWFWQIGFVLYNPFVDPWGSNRGGMEHMGGHEADQGGSMDNRSTTDHNTIMMIVASFSWHMAINFVIMLVIGAIIGCYYRRRGDLDDEKILMQEINPASKGYTVISLDGGEQEEDIHN